jgi:hypothetical protein
MKPDLLPPPAQSDQAALGLSAAPCWAPSSFLVCCEHSGMVREALRAKGVDAWSCDLLPADDASPYHIQGDCRDAMRSREWGGYGMHPDCTYLTVAGIHWNNRGRGWEKTDAALAFVRELIELAGDKPWYLENPVSIISTKIRKPTQTIQPYDFGEDASKWSGGRTRPTAGKISWHHPPTGGSCEARPTPAWRLQWPTNGHRFCWAGNRSASRASWPSKTCDNHPRSQHRFVRLL